ncbi:hypothetical protein [[Phormidium] sp. ETS-05]|uniref:hypothetical protein n=1 Tax=[Phormidium] sp. ETS-05 TaxID=222819 RepID=UPI0018EF16C1|nr:hypothetical protein [[Phormidium] sp. ETS-05]
MGEETVAGASDLVSLNPVSTGQSHILGFYSSETMKVGRQRRITATATPSLGNSLSDGAARPTSRNTPNKCNQEVFSCPRKQ